MNSQASKTPACADEAEPARRRPVWFPEWPDALRLLRLPPIRHQQYRLALIRYLKFCKETRQRATVDSARAFMETVHAQRMLSLSMLATWKEALNWFFTEGQKQNGQVGTSRRLVRNDGNERARRRLAPTNTITAIPTQGDADLGETDWERKLIQVLRTRHYQWRTEQAYRAWAWRFVDWMEGNGVGGRASRRAESEVGSAGASPSRRLEDATATDVRDFLTDLATRQRVSASTQKQALNALVFLLREGAALCHPAGAGLTLLARVGVC